MRRCIRGAAVLGWHREWRSDRRWLRGQESFRERVRRGFLFMFSLVSQQTCTAQLYSRLLLTITGFLEAMPWIAMRREDGNLVPTRLETNSSINDQSLGTANAEIWVEKDDALLLCHC